MKKIEADEHIKRWTALLESYINKPARVIFDKHTAIVEIQSITIATQKSMRDNKYLTPEKRIMADNKQYTPAVIQMTCNSCSLFFVIEDFELYAVMGGVEIVSPGIIVRIEKG